jgi:hypothetical protein
MLWGKKSMWICDFNLLRELLTELYFYLNERIFFFQHLIIIDPASFVETNWNCAMSYEKLLSNFCTSSLHYFSRKKTKQQKYNFSKGNKVTYCRSWHVKIVQVNALSYHKYAWSKGYYLWQKFQFVYIYITCSLHLWFTTLYLYCHC